MAINKNFIIKNGLEVDENLIYANSVTSRVGIVTSNPQYTLDVRGGIGASAANILGNLVLGGALSVGSTTGQVGQYLVSTGIGATWVEIPDLRQTQTFTAGVGQTSFGFSYSPVAGVDVYVNGIRLSDSEYSAVDGSSIVLNTACFGEETVDLIAYSITGLGAGVTGITGVTVLDEGIVIGNASNIISLNFVGASVTATSTGYGVTVYVGDAINPNYWSETLAGIHTLSNVGLGTTNPTYYLEVGPVGYADTALWVNGNARVTGILTVGTSSIILDGSSNIINVGSGVTIDGSSGIIQATSIDINGETLSGAGVTYITAGSGISVDQNTGNVTISATGGGGGESYWASSEVGIHTLSNVGIGTTNATDTLTVKGNTSLETLTVSGISTFNDQVDVFADVIVQGSIGINTTITDSTFVISGAGESSPEIMLLDGPNSGNRFGLFSQNGNETIITSRDGNEYGTIKLNQYNGVDLGRTAILIPPSGNIGIGTTNPTSKLDIGGDVNVTGIVTATGGFISVGNTTPIQISLDGNQLTFTAVGIGSTTFTLF